MRKIETLARNAFYNKGNFRQSNTSVSTEPWGGETISKYRLHGNTIAEYFNESKTLKIWDCGWQSNTTKSRLNSILPHNVFIQQIKYVWYINTWGKTEPFEGFKSIQL